MIDLTLLFGFEEELDIDRSAPIKLIVFLARLIIAVHINTYLGIIEVFFVSGNGDDRQGDVSWEEDIRLCSGAWREFSVEEELCLDNGGIRY